MSGKPLAIDLCCGKGGWTIGLLDTGWDVIGFDTKNHGYPSQLVLQDVRTLDGTRFCGKIGLVVASPPCQEFSYRSFPFKRCHYLRDNVPPDTSIWDACVRIAKEANVPLVLENVRGAVRYMGPAVNKYGPFYLWGDVPALLPDGRGVQKGFGPPKGADLKIRRFKTESYKRMLDSEKYRKGFAGEYERIEGLVKKEFNKGESKHQGSQISSRKEWSAKVAMIPYELSHWIGEVFMPKNYTTPAAPSRSDTA